MDIPRAAEDDVSEDLEEEQTGKQHLLANVSRHNQTQHIVPMWLFWGSQAHQQHCCQCSQQQQLLLQLLPGIDSVISLQQARHKQLVTDSVLG